MYVCQEEVFGDSLWLSNLKPDFFAIFTTAFTHKFGSFCHKSFTFRDVWIRETSGTM